MDGGTGTGSDTANYSSSPIGIKVWVDKVDDKFDVYKVEDGFVVKGQKTVDTLGNIEIISGSNFAAQMTGGDYSDIF
ncbi:MULTISPECIES: hypothetical protein [unclassified Microcoleus]|uniref:hypothetical protein n=1 Tax=unclassified Microcoleus TaxID=2642155 RepID=UPI002FD13EFE